MNQLLMLLGGCTAMLAGVAAVVFRSAVARRNRENIEAKFGPKYPAARRSSPAMMAWLGCLLALLGLFLVVKSIFGW